MVSSEPPDGMVVHGEVRLDDARIWLHRATDGLASPQALTQLDGGLVRAQEAGAVIDSEPTDQEYGPRQYGARDLEGHHWWLATPTAAPALPDR